MEIYLKKLDSIKNTNQRYLNWINNLKLTKYTEQRFKKKLIDLKKIKSCLLHNK